MKRTSFNPWPGAIITTLIVFAAGLVSFITLASRQGMELVRTDYYEEELRYQAQLDRMQRTRSFQDQISVIYDSDRLSLRLPSAHAGAVGRIEFYRPSDSKLDRKVPLRLDSKGTQRVEGEPLKPGLWKVRVFWTLDPDGERYHEQVVVVPDRS